MTLLLVIALMDAVALAVLALLALNAPLSPE